MASKLKTHVRGYEALVDDDIHEQYKDDKWLYLGWVQTDDPALIAMQTAIKIVGGKIIHLEELVMDVTDGTRIERINGIGLDLRRENLVLREDLPKRVRAERGYSAVVASKARKEGKL